MDSAETEIKAKHELTSLVIIPARTELHSKGGIWFRHPKKRFLMQVTQSEQPITIWSLVPNYHWTITLYYTFTHVGYTRYSDRARYRNGYICEHAELLGREQDNNKHQWQGWSASTYGLDRMVKYTYNYKSVDQFMVKLDEINRWLYREIPENVADNTDEKEDDFRWIENLH